MCNYHIHICHKITAQSTTIAMHDVSPYERVVEEVGHGYRGMK
jgi:hypothetical protein